MTTHKTQSKNTKSPGKNWGRTVFAATACCALFGTGILADTTPPPSDEFNYVVLDTSAFQSITTKKSTPHLSVIPTNYTELEITDTPQKNSENTRSPAEFTLEQFLFRGVVNWGGYRFTYYSQQVLPGGGLNIPGRHVNEAGYVSDGDGFIVLAGDAPKGTVYATPFGYPGKIYDRGTYGNHLDVYIR